MLWRGGGVLCGVVVVWGWCVVWCGSFCVVWRGGVVLCGTMSAAWWWCCVVLCCVAWCCFVVGRAMDRSGVGCANITMKAGGTAGSRLDY